LLAAALTHGCLLASLPTSFSEEPLKRRIPRKSPVVVVVGKRTYALKAPSVRSSKARRE
jgi:hypothetical protein